LLTLGIFLKIYRRRHHFWAMYFPR
jgi:hypothetical protein